MIVKVLVQNLGHGGLRTGSGDPRRPLAPASPAVHRRRRHRRRAVPGGVRLGRFGEKQLRRAAADLGLQALPLAPSSSGYPTCVLCWPETVGTPVSWNTDFAHTVIHGFGVAALDVGLPTPLSFISAHLSPFGALRALMEADMIIHGPTGMAPTRSSPETSTTRQRTGRIRYSTA